MKSLLILGAGPDQVIGIKKAKKLGFYTITLDGNKDSIGNRFSDEFHKVNIKKIEKIKDFLKNKLNRKIHGVIAFGVDIAHIIAQTADFLGVNYTVSQESAILSEDKFLAKEFMKENKIAIPSYELVTKIEDIKIFVEKYGFPVVLKPVDNSAARGISFIKNLENIEKYYEYALNSSLQKKLVIEKYLGGPQISTESFIVNEKIYNIGFSDRNYEDMERFLPNIIENGGDLPSIFIKEEHKVKLEKYLGIISKKLNIKNGVIKGDIVIHNDELYIIEFALRLSGGNFSTIEIPASTGVDFLKIAIKLHTNEEVFDEELKVQKNNYISLRYKFLEDINIGRIKDIKTMEGDSILSQTLFLKKGDKIDSNKTLNHANRVASVIAKGKNREDAILKCENYLKSLKIEME